AGAGGLRYLLDHFLVEFDGGLAAEERDQRVDAVALVAGDGGDPSGEGPILDLHALAVLPAGERLRPAPVASALATRARACLPVRGVEGSVRLEQDERADDKGRDS